MKAYRRSDRVGELMLREISDVIRRQVKDPRVGFCTVTRVILSSDLEHAKVYVSTIGSPEEGEETLLGLQKATPFIRREIAHRLQLRYTPEIRFLTDKSLEHLDHISRLLDEVAEDISSEEE